MAEAGVRLRAVDETRAAFASVETSLRRLGSSASVIRGAFGGIAGALGVGGLLSLARDITRAVVEAEQSEARLSAVLRATQGAVGLTRDELEGLISDLAGKTLFDDEALRNATAVLATFKSVAGDTFRTTLELAADLSGLLGGDLQSAVLQLGKALEDPERGLTALTRVGVSFSPVQRKLIKDLVDSNRLLDAQKIILEAVAGQVGRTAREMNTGLVGATTSATKAWNDLLEAFGRTSSVSAPVAQTLNAMAFSFKALEDAIKQFDDRTRSSLLFQGNPNLAGRGARLSDLLKKEVKEIEGLRPPPLPELSKEQAEALRAASARLPRGRTTQILPETAPPEEPKRKKRDEFAEIVQQLERERQSIAQLTAEQRILEEVEAKRIKLTPDQERKVRGLVAEVEQRRVSRQALEDEAAAEQALFDTQLDNLRRRSEFAEDFRQEEERQRQEVERTAEAYRQLADPTRRYRQELEEIARLQASGALGAEEAVKARQAIEKEIDAIENKTSDVAKSLGLTFSSAIEDAIVQMRDLGDVVDAVFQDILRLAVRKSITEPLFEAVGGLFSGGGGGAGFVGELAKMFGFAHGGIMTPRGPLALESYAMGGIAGRPTLALFGEGRRNEAFVPLPDGRSIPVQMRGGQQGVVVNMNVYAQDADSFRRSRRQILGELRSQLKFA